MLRIFVENDRHTINFPTGFEMVNNFVLGAGILHIFHENGPFVNFVGLHDFIL